MNQNEFESALSKLVDGKLSPSEFDQLELCLQSSAEARENYLQFIALHDGLDSEMQRLSSAQMIGTPVVPIDEILKRQNKRNLYTAMIVAAAVVLLTFFPLRIWLITEDQSPGVTYRVAHSSNYSVSGRATDEEIFHIEKGEHVILEQGSMELSFRNGVRSVINGPAEFTLLDGDVLEMNRGVGWFQVPQQAIGFKVITESLEVVDLGTEFGVLAGSHIRDEVHVLKGKVRVKPLLIKGLEIDLSAGEARVVSLSGDLSPIDLAPNAFLRTLPDTLPYLYWSFDKEESSEYVVKGNDPISSDLASGVYPSSDGSGVRQLYSGKSGLAISPIGEAGLATDWYGISGGAPRSASFWGKLPSQMPAHLTLFGWGAQSGPSDASSRAFYTYMNEGFVGLAFGGYWVRTERRIDDSKWHHLVVVYTGKPLVNGDPEVDFYIDGSLAATEPARRSNVVRSANGAVTVDTAGRNNGGSPFAIFRHNYNAWKNGDQTGLAIDELFIFKGALSSKEVQNLHDYNTNLLQSF
jgi:hypothetical protein